MTFVIGQQNEISKVFDPEPYNYLLNKSSGIINGLENPENFSLKKILECFESKDPHLLELLNYKHDGLSAIEIALENNLYNKIDSILEFMAKLKYINPHCYGSVLHKLLSYKMFDPFFSSLLQ